MFIVSPNNGKYRPEKTPYLDTFHAVALRRISMNVYVTAKIFAFKLINKVLTKFKKSFLSLQKVPLFHLILFCGKAQFCRVLAKLCGNCAFAQIFHNRNLGDIMLFYDVFFTS